MRPPTYTVGHVNLLRLPPGEDLLVGLYRTCRECGIELGTFSANGWVRNATLGHLDQETGEQRREALESGQDLVECSGNISIQGDSFYVRAFAILSDSQGRVTAGELLAAEVYVVEVCIQQVKGPRLIRQPDPETGLWLWPVF